MRALWEKTAKEEDPETNNPKKTGTVGAVCLDKEGNLCAATSTGGLNYKLVGRVGDSGVIGGGTYANNETCAVSCTGEGEKFIQSVTAFEIHSLIKYAGVDLQTATKIALDNVKKINGVGGLIAIDKYGNVSMPLTTKMMGRGFIKDNVCEMYVFPNGQDITETVYRLD